MFSVFITALFKIIFCSLCFRLNFDFFKALGINLIFIYISLSLNNHIYTSPVIYIYIYIFWASNHGSISGIPQRYNLSSLQVYTPTPHNTCETPLSILIFAVYPSWAITLQFVFNGQIVDRPRAYRISWYIYTYLNEFREAQITSALLSVTCFH